MPARSSFDYAVVRVVPHVEREEFLNAGIILFCRTQEFLAAEVELHRDRLLALAPDVDVEEVRHHLAAVPRLAAGGAQAGPIGRLTQAERFHWLVAPSSTSVQPSAVHSGLCHDPAVTLQHLMDRMVRLSA